MFEWTSGIKGRSANPLSFPQNALTAGENMDLSAGGLRSRNGTSITGAEGMPAGTVRGLWQVRFPTNETSYLLAQVEYDLGFQAGAATGPYRMEHSAIWDTANSRMIVFGGREPDQWVDGVLTEPEGPRNDVWSYDPAADTWVELTCTGTPPAARWRHTAIYDPIGARMVVFGGQNTAGAYLNDLWSLNLSTLAWTELTDSGDIPSVRGNHTAIYRSLNKTMVVCGGWYSSGARSVRDVYSLDLSTYAWTLTSYSGGDFPGPRGWHVAMYDSVNDFMLIFAGGSGEVSYTDLWRTQFNGTWTELADVSTRMYDPNLGPQRNCAVFFAGALFSAFGMYLDIDGDDKCLLVWNQQLNTWASSGIKGDPAGRTDASAVVTDTGLVIVFGGQLNATQTPTNEVWLINGAFGTAARGCSLFASNTPLPSGSAVFREIYDLGEGAGLCSVAVLNDRAVITEGVNKVPLVFSGCMTDDASDWAVPKAVLVSPDDANYYDAPEVLDKDPDTATDVSNIRMQGHIDICLDMPKAQAVYIEMGSPNSGLPVEAQVFSNTVDMTDADELLRHDRAGSIVRWHKDGPTKGHFEGPEIDIDAGPAMDKGGGLVGIPSTGHGLTAGQKIRIEGTTFYNGFYTLHTATTLNELVITKTYTAEMFNVGTEKVYRRFTLGPGNDCPDVVPGMVVKFVGTELTILSVGGDGADSQSVVLSQDHESANILAVYGLVRKDSELTVNYAPTSSLISSFLKTLDGNPFIAARCVSVRQVIRATDLVASGDYIDVTIETASGESTNTQYNDSTILLGASIVERSGATGNGVTAPTPLAFSDGGIWAPGTSRTTRLMKFSIDETKDYLIIMDFISYRVYYNMGLYPYQADYGKIPSAYLKQKLEGGGYYFKTGVSLYDRNFWKSSNLAAMPSGFTDYTQHTATIGVSRIRVQTNRSASTALHVACTSDANNLPLYAADALVKVAPHENTPGSSIVRHAVSLDQRATWMVFKSQAWRTIVQFNQIAWQYKDDSDVWRNATENTMAHALFEAFGVLANQMSGNELAALTRHEWDGRQYEGGFLPRITQYIDLAVGMQIDAAGNIPSIASYAVTFNDVGTALVEGFAGSTWTQGSGWTDDTKIDGAPLARSGVISYDGGVMTLDYTVINGVPGYWLRIRMNGTSPNTSITRILYKAPCQPLANIGDGQPDKPSGFLYYDASENHMEDFTFAVGDNTLSNFSTALVPMATADKLYIGYPEQFNAVEIWPYVENNKVTSVLSAKYWTGSEWATLTITDGTAGDGAKTLSGLGKISWSVPVDWKANIPFDGFFSRGFWARFKVSSALSPNTAVVECRVYAIPTTLAKHKFCEVSGNRLYLGARPDAPDQIDVSRPLEEYGFTGSDSGSCRVGGMDSIQALKSAWNTLFVWKTESCHQLVGSSPEDFRFEMVEAARHIPINSRVIVKAPMGGSDGDRYGLFFINRFGAYVNTGLHTDALWNTSRGASLAEGLDWWDDNATPRLDPDHLHLACGEYWPTRNWVIWSVPMIVSGDSQRTNNRLIVYDLNLRAWLPQFTIGLASLTVAYHFNSHAPNRLGEIGLYGGDYSGRIIRVFHPVDATDAGVPVNCWVETGWLSFGSPEFRKVLRLVSLHGKATDGPVTITVHTDGAESSPFTLSFDNLWNLAENQFVLEQQASNFQGRFFKFRISFSGAGEIHGIQLGVSFVRDWGAL
jgi:hypothetical protein